MATLQAQYDLASTRSFMERVLVAAVATAIYCTIEDAGTTGHAARKAYALQVLAAPEVRAMDLALGIATDATIQSAGADCTDGEISQAMASLWNSYAGA